MGRNQGGEKERMRVEVPRVMACYKVKVWHTWRGIRLSTGDLHWRVGGATKKTRDGGNFIEGGEHTGEKLSTK